MSQATPRPQAHDEKRLLQGLRTGMHEAYSEFIDSYAARIYRLCYGFVQDPMEAQDLTQEVFLRILKHVGEFKGESSITTWVYRITVNVCLDRLRQQKRRMDILQLDRYMPTFDESERLRDPVWDWSTLAPLDNLLKKEAKEVIAKAISGLPPDFRVVLVLKDVEGISLKEISEALELSLPAVKSRLHRARLALRGVLSSYFKDKLRNN
jgi:RNA polymerase sigma-70 factor (ECF subfamily)